MITNIPSKKPTAKVAYLRDHMRYYTMNSWNRATSYACNIKISHLNLTHEQRNACYEMLDLIEQSGFRDILRQFDEEHNYEYQIGQNGRSGGYLVLYSGGRKPSGYKSHCPVCWQRNYKPAPGPCGRCGHPERVNDATTHMTTFTMPGKEFDAPFDVVWSFDKACEAACASFVDFATSHRAEEQEILVPKTIRVAVEK